MWKRKVRLGLGSEDRTFSSTERRKMNIKCILSETNYDLFHFTENLYKKYIQEVYRCFGKRLKNNIFSKINVLLFYSHIY